MIGVGESAIIISAIVLVFGATRIPKIAKSMGEGLKEFKKALKEAKETDEEGKEKNQQEENSEETSADKRE